MKIQAVQVTNFKSIVDVTTDFSDFNILVGRNNCGKTNFFDAIQFFYTGLGRGQKVESLKFQRNAELLLSVRITFSGIQHGAANMKNSANRTKITELIGDNDTIVIERNCSNPKKRKVYLAGEEVNPGTGFDSALNDFLPKFEYVSTKQYFDAVAKYGKTTPMGVMLSGVVAAILETSQKYKDFQEKFAELFEHEDSEVRTQFETIGDSVKIYLEKQFPDCTKVSFEVTPPAFDDLLKNFDTVVDDGVETYAEEKGDGMQRALMLAIIQTYADFRKERENAGKSFIFFIDEAELHLHPTAQRKLKDVLYELSEAGDQVFINTHSSVFVADRYEGQHIYQVQKEDRKTQVSLVSTADMPYLIFELLGGSPADLLLPRNFLIVEGQSEVLFLQRVIARFYSTEPAIQIIEAKGDVDQTERLIDAVNDLYEALPKAKTINAIEKSYTPIKSSIYQDRVVMLFDHPSDFSKGAVADFHGKYPELRANNQCFEMPVRDLEQYYPDQDCDTYGNWKKPQEQLDATNAKGKRTFRGRKKVQMAKHIGDNISKEQFEQEMPIVYECLQRCWALTF
jgi:predicted ATP-binding protein involved in virulence